MSLCEITLSVYDKGGPIYKYCKLTGKHCKIREMITRLIPYYWRGMMSDIRAFIKACPVCQKGAGMCEQDSLEVTDQQEEPTDPVEMNNTPFEDCTEEFRPIIDYLKDKTLPKETCDGKAELALKTKTNMFFLEEDGSLFYLNSTYVDKSGARKKRRVIYTPEEKKERVEECHIITTTGEHKSKGLTHSAISMNYYWPHMAREVARYLRSCTVCNNDPVPRDVTSQVSQGVSQRNCQKTAGPVSTASSSQNSADISTPELSPGENATCTPALSHQNSQPRSNTCSSRNRKRTPEYTAYEEENLKKMRKSKSMKIDDDRIEKFKIRFAQKNVFDAKEEIQKEHGYSAQQDHIECEVEESLERIAGNEVEIETDTPEPRATQDDLHVPENDSSFQVLMEVVESANLAENTRPRNSEESPVIDGGSPGGKRKNRWSQKYKCTECGLLTGGHVKLKLHMSTHTGQKPFSCPTCHSKFTTMRSVRQHEIKHRAGAQLRKFLCDSCGLEFRSIGLLKTHKEAVHRKTHPCKHCDQVFQTKALLTQHENSCGVNGAGVLCQICSTLCATKSEYRSHVLGHAGLDIRDPLQRIEPPQDSPQIELISTEVCSEEGEVISVQIEIPESMEVGEGGAEHQGHAIDAHQSLLQLAEQVVKARLDTRENVEYQYQVVCGEDSDQIVIVPVQHDNS